MRTYRRFKKPINPREYPMPPRFTGNRSRRAVSANRRKFSRSNNCGPFRGAAPFPKRRSGTGGTGGKRWVVVTGLVPYKKQLAEYRAKFEGAAGNDPAKDVPKYCGYFVQRAEVVPGDGTRVVEVHDLRRSTQGGDRQDGRPTAEEIADPRLVCPSLDLALAPLVDATWGNEAVSPPQIPIVETQGATRRRNPPDREAAPPTSTCASGLVGRQRPRSPAPAVAGSAAAPRTGAGGGHEPLAAGRGN